MRMFLVKHCSPIHELVSYGEGEQSLACTIPSPSISFDSWMAETFCLALEWARPGIETAIVNPGMGKMSIL